MKNTINKIKKFFTTNFKMKLLVAYLIANLVYLLIGSYIFTTNNITNNFHLKEFSLGLRNLLVLNAITFFAICLEKRYKKNWVHLILALIAVFGVISVYFAIDRKSAIYGVGGRYEGIYSILYYLSLMLLTTFVSPKYKKVLTISILLGGTFQACYAICQIYQLFNVKLVWHTYRTWNEATGEVVKIRRVWPVGCITNPNFFGTYMLLCLSYSLGMFLDSKKIVKNILYCIWSALFMYGLLISNTSSVVVGLAVVLLYILVYCIKNKLFLKLFVIAVILANVTFLAVQTGKTKLFKDIKVAGNEATQIAKGNSDDSFGTNRVFIWKNTIKIVPKYLWHGAGIDNFTKAFDGKALMQPRIYNKKTQAIEKISVYDKAHNEYLQILVTQGIFALIAYLALYGYVTAKGIKHSFKNNEIYLILPIIGYLVQAFFNISVIEVAPIFFMALGLCCQVSKRDGSKN